MQDNSTAVIAELKATTVMQTVNYCRNYFSDSSAASQHFALICRGVVSRIHLLVLRMLVGLSKTVRKIAWRFTLNVVLTCVNTLLIFTILIKPKYVLILASMCCRYAIRAGLVLHLRKLGNQNYSSLLVPLSLGLTI